MAENDSDNSLISLHYIYRYIADQIDISLIVSGYSSMILLMQVLNPPHMAGLFYCILLWLK